MGENFRRPSLKRRTSTADKMFLKISANNRNKGLSELSSTSLNQSQRRKKSNSGAPGSNHNLKGHVSSTFSLTGPPSPDLNSSPIPPKDNKTNDRLEAEVRLDDNKPKITLKLSSSPSVSSDKVSQRGSRPLKLSSVPSVSSTGSTKKRKLKPLHVSSSSVGSASSDGLSSLPKHYVPYKKEKAVIEKEEKKSLPPIRVKSDQTLSEEELQENLAWQRSAVKKSNSSSFDVKSRKQIGRNEAMASMQEQTEPGREKDFVVERSSVCSPLLLLFRKLFRSQ